MSPLAEDQRREWKESWRDEHLKIVCAFANSQGGVLEIGRDDAGKVLGLPNVAKLLEDLPNKMRDLLGVVADVQLWEEKGNPYLRIAVDPYPYPVSYRGEYFVRSGSTRQALKGAALDRFLLSRTGKRWDAVPLPGVSATELVADTLERFRRRARKSKRLGNEALQRVESYPIPESALREALLNAVVHRDYAVAAPIQIRVHTDRLLIWNPGELPENWTLDKLLGRHFSFPFNPDIANVFFRAGDIEAWGRGIQRVLDACREAQTPEPRIRVEQREFLFEFPFSKAYLESFAAQKTPVKTPDLILDALTASPRLTLAEVADIIGKSLSAVERASARLVKDGRLRHVGPRKGGQWQVLGEKSDDTRQESA